ncbi:right-handed parallel beta-helix repeat-containing protein, partial [Candidatus Roizmanbacteria bacterium]|nr:right-handed parallel beta-helix repeat-containing protein [Candidatus Roizmanbacteria bacterium]
IIRNNISYNNKGHGLMLHEQSDRNTIEGNKFYGNADGIFINDSHYNAIARNQIYANANGVRANKNSRENLVEKNRIYDNAGIGMYLYGNADKNVIKENLIARNRYGVYVKSNDNQFTGNTVSHNKVGFYLLAKGSGNKIVGNEISYTDSYPVYAKLSGDLQNFLSNNVLTRNKREIYARE